VPQLWPHIALIRALSGDDPTTVLARLGDAQIALRGESGRRIVWIDRDLAPAGFDVGQIEAELRRSLERGAISLRFQPQFALADDALIGAEALVRWDQPLLGDIGGEALLRIAARADLTTQLTRKVIEAALDDYKSDLESLDARIQMRFSFPVRLGSLRSGLSGYQYYDIALELVESDGQRRKFMHLDYVYSSTCPCSLELSEHARATRGQLATPHSQRSVARISVALDRVEGDCLWFEDLIGHCRRAVPTETQVMVKREDEQAFAELNAANPMFVEDAARLFSGVLLEDPRIGDFRVVASHQESLHSHDAVSVLTEGETFAAQSLDPRLFASLFHVG